MDSTSTLVCYHFMFGFCKFGDKCRKHHIYEICSEVNCENKNCFKRHPKTCKFYDMYKRCNFNDYCIYAHRESPKVCEINILKIKVETLEEDINDKSNEVMDFKEKWKHWKNL